MPHEYLTLAQRRASGGFALITGLIFLVVMSLIGVSMMKATRLETMMAGGTREAGIAFQAAEAALRDGEDWIESTTSVSDVQGVEGALTQSQVEPDFFASSTWSDGASDSSPLAQDYPELEGETQPRRIVKHLGDFLGDSEARQAIAVGGYAQGETNAAVSVFRITAWGTSRDGSAETLLQSHYGKRY
jgi:type IV pilus assembly protein PilX